MSDMSEMSDMSQPAVPSSRNRAQAELIEYLGRMGTWAGRSDIDAAMGWSQQRVDDELGDLVMAGQVQFNERARSYRLMGPPLARAALRRMLLEPGHQKGFELGQVRPDGKLMRVGLARRVAATGEQPQRLLMAELELPFPGGKDLPALDAFLGQVVAALNTRAMGANVGADVGAGQP